MKVIRLCYRLIRSLLTPEKQASSKRALWMMSALKKCKATKMAKMKQKWSKIKVTGSKMHPIAQVCNLMILTRFTHIIINNQMRTKVALQRHTVIPYCNHTVLVQIKWWWMCRPVTLHLTKDSHRATATWSSINTHPRSTVMNEPSPMWVSTKRVRKKKEVSKISKIRLVTSVWYLNEI